MDYALKYRTLRETLRLSQAELAMHSGTSRSIISQIEIGKLRPSLENIASLSKSLNIKLEYFFEDNADLNVYLNVYPNVYPNGIVANQTTSKGRIKDQVDKGNVLLIPVKARAGYLAGFGDTNFLSTLVPYNIPGCKNGRYRMFEIDGYSMFPTFSTGDFVVGERIDSFDEMREDTIYIMVSKTDGILIKRLLNVDKVSNKLAFSSDNADRDSYPNLAVAMQDVAEIWRFYILITRLAGEQGKVMGCLQNLDKKMVKILSILGSK